MPTICKGYSATTDLHAQWPQRPISRQLAIVCPSVIKLATKNLDFTNTKNRKINHQNAELW